MIVIGGKAKPANTDRWVDVMVGGWYGLFFFLIAFLFSVKQAAENMVGGGGVGSLRIEEKL